MRHEKVCSGAQRDERKTWFSELSYKGMYSDVGVSNCCFSCCLFIYLFIYLLKFNYADDQNKTV